jgi:hypothetical protein
MHKRIRVTKVRGGVFGAVVMTLALAAGVFAYFGGAGSSGNVPGVAIGGSGGTFTVTAAYTSTGSTTVTPGAGAMVFAVTVTNSTASSLTLDAVNGTIVATAGNVYNVATSSVATGCLATWFTIQSPTGTWLINSGQTSLPHALNNTSANTAIGTLTLTMPADSSDNQSVCEGVIPQISVTAS